MPIFGDMDALVGRLRHQMFDEQQPISFVFGAGATQPIVPGTSSLVNKMRESLSASGEVERFDQEVGGTEPSERYQQAATFLKQFRGQKALNRIIRMATLGACTSLSPDQKALIMDDDIHLCLAEENEKWRLPRGLIALSRVLACVDSVVHGPIITTNFDPLIEISLRKAGLQYTPHFLDMDGRFSKGLNSGIDIVHVHGYWRRIDTLHNHQQLTARRQVLAASLKRALQGHLIVVMGYGGWEDVFSNALIDLVQESPARDIDILWCFNARCTQEALDRGKLLPVLASCYNVNFYHGIEINQAFDRIWREELPPEWALDGWVRTDTDALCGDSIAEVLPFFDGAHPTFATALHSDVPILSFANNLLRQALKCLESDDTKVVVGIGPMGEGKTMALHQVALEICSQCPDVEVFWCQEGARLDIHKLKMAYRDPQRKLVLFSDNGDLLIKEILGLFSADAEDYSNIRFILTAHEGEWLSRGGPRRMGRLADLVATNGLLESDAKLLIEAWQKYGEQGLGKLAAVPDDKRVQELMKLANPPSNDQAKNSLYGAMLAARLGPTIQERMEGLLKKLDTTEVKNHSLTEAFLAIALCQAPGQMNQHDTASLSKAVLGAMLGMQLGDVEGLVVPSLGREAENFIGEYGDHIRIRHLSIAKTALEVSQKRNPAELQQVARQLVGAAARSLPNTGFASGDLYRVAHLSASIQPLAVAVAAAEAATSEVKNRWSLWSTRIVVHRREGGAALETALEIAAEAWEQRSAMCDPKNEPIFLIEWSRAAEEAQPPQPMLSVMLAAIALHVTRSFGQVDFTLHGKCLVHLCRGLAKLSSQIARDPVFSDALQGVAAIAEQFAMPAHVAQSLAAACGDPAWSEGKLLSAHDGWLRIQKAINQLSGMNIEPLKSYLEENEIRLS